MSKKKLSLSNQVKSVTPQCKVVVYNWDVSTSMSDDVETRSLDLFGDDDLSKATPIDVSSQILNFTYSKNLGGPTGTFNFQLANGEKSIGDWKDVIKKGTWCLIYLSQNGDLNIRDTVGAPISKSASVDKKYLRCIGYIDRVSVTSSMSDTGAYDVVFSISGRDFGVVYEDTTIWHNQFQFDNILLQSLTDTKLNVTGNTSLDVAMRLIHNLFFNPTAIPGAVINDQKSLTSTALQWLMPQSMIKDLGLSVTSGGTYWGSLDTTVFEQTKATIAVESTTAFLTGNAWEQLKRLSSPAFHELFTEIDDLGDDTPALFFRPIPFAIDKSKYKTVGEYVKLYKDITSISVGAIDVLEFDLGEDGHSRYNSYLATIESSTISINDNISYLEGTGFPKFVQSSIKRHGFRPMHVTADNIVKDAQNTTDKGTPIMIAEFNEVLYDYWAYAILAESGVFSLVGRNDVRLGKCIVTQGDVPYASNRRYYIEGYTDTFSVDDTGNATWTQQVDVTRGLSEETLTSKENFFNRFDKRNEVVKTAGEFTKKGGK